MKGNLLVIAGIVFFVLIVFLARVPILKSIGSFLVARDELKKADVIVVLGGESGRVVEAARLYKQGFSGHMIMTGGAVGKGSVAEGMRRHAVSLGVPRENIILEPEAQSTYQHPVLVKPIMRARGFQSAIVVSSPFHMRRSAMLFNRAFRESGIELIYHPVRDSWFQADNWWTKAVSRRAVRLEYVKLAVNVWGNGFSKLVGELVKSKK